MDYVESSYCRLTKVLLLCFGQWPYHSTAKRRVISSFVFAISAICVVPKVIKIVNICRDLEKMIDCIPIFLLDVVDYIKMGNNIINFNKMHELFNRIQADWIVKRSDAERETMVKYAEEAQKFTNFYALFMYFTTFMYCCMPIIPIILDVVLPLNESRPLVYLFHAEYFVDQEKFYYLILIHSYISCLIAVSILLAIDTEYAIHVYHGCSIFGIVRCKLENLTTQGTIVDCIKQHKKAIEYASYVESSRTSSLFFIIGINIAAISITGVQTVLKMNEPTEAIRFGIYTLSQILHIFYNSYPAQKLIDASTEVNDAIYSSNWQGNKIKSKQLLIVMMMRAQQPCQLTVGKIYVMSLASFSTVVKTSMSYFTVLLSFQ